jgi:Protein of unknown function (DUF1153)
VTRNKTSPIAYVIGPAGNVLTIADLPPANTKRWVLRRKAEVLAAVHGGLLSLEDACTRYRLTVEEFTAWQEEVKSRSSRSLRRGKQA